MANLYKLRNHIKHYAWGSASLIPQLLGVSGDGSPWAELWMGSHAASPSQAILPSGDISLRELIAGDPRRCLGEKTAERYGELPFLFKLLAAEKPLSIQAHPNRAQARAGFERENQAHIAPDAPNRNYRDSSHKPELFCALTPFTGMCGFRSPAEIARLLSVFGGAAADAPAIVREGFVPLLRALETPAPAVAVRNFLDALFSLSQPVRAALTRFALSAAAAEDGADLGGGEWELVRALARQYPDDPAIIAPLYLCVVRLKPGEAIFIDAGVPHAYIHGLGIELMANSDNVLRGGLTSKHVDIPALMQVLDFTPAPPRIIKPEPPRPPDSAWRFTYPAPCAEFSLTVMSSAAVGSPSGSPTPAAFTRPAIVIVTEGCASLGGMALQQGESAFIPGGADSGGPADEPLLVQGRYTLYAASVPS